VLEACLTEIGRGVVQHTAKFESWLVLVIMVLMVIFVGEGWERGWRGVVVV
jgi:hypothetical protein